MTSLSNEPGTFKVVIERPSHGRPKTADTSSFPLLQVPIPHYRLGTPRFSTRGTADLRSSVYTRASGGGVDDFANSLLTPQRGVRQSFLSSRPLSEAYSPVPHRFRATMDRPPAALSGPSSARVSQAPIGPRLYDALTANPDDRAVVRFNVHGDMIAATPARLVAHITSPSFLDYELLSSVSQYKAQVRLQHFFSSPTILRSPPPPSSRACRSVYRLLTRWQKLQRKA